MFNNVGLDIFIGLIFIYLLYSLLATIIAEIIATQLGIRALNLKEAVDRMLSDTQNLARCQRWMDTLNLRKNPDNERINKFYNNPEVKYLGSTGIFKNPSSFKAETFSRTLLYELNGSGLLDRNNIETELKTLAKHFPQNANPPNPGVNNNPARTLDVQSAQFVLSLFNYSNGDLDKFKIHLEAWFDRTMDQATEWYKRKIQVILVVLGFFMAWIFNAGTFTILNKLSTDKDAREKLVQMASAHLQNSKSQNGGNANLTTEEKNNINKIEEKLQNDISDANNLLGLGSWLPDKFVERYDKLTGKKIYEPKIDEALILDKFFLIDTPLQATPTKPVTYKPNLPYKIAAFLLLSINHFWGYFVTALAISLGAPFWFDLLNKLMQLRTSVKVPTNTTDDKDHSISRLNRIG